jgi:hypothetical protein
MVGSPDAPDSPLHSGADKGDIDAVDCAEADPMPAANTIAPIVKAQ